MGRNSGGVTTSGKGGRSSGLRGATENGYTAKMVKNIVGMEQKYRHNEYETLHVFNSEGDIVTSFRGNSAYVKIDLKKVPVNSILTHNHPSALKFRGILRIGASFSKEDISLAINTNAKEMRAVTPTYTFSVKRPKSGWGVTAGEIAKVYNHINNLVWNQREDYHYKSGEGNDQINRAAITHHHKIMKMLAKRYGWNYSKKNS